jgi:serine/threonine protein kinase
MRFDPRSPEEISLHTEAAGSAPPDAFGPFRVLHQIGAGALGPVFRAYDPGQDKLVAVKLFRVDLPPDRVHELVADFERLIAADLTHSAIVAAIATGIVQVSPYLAQDFVAADSLDTVLREHGPAPAGEALRIVTQIAGGLDYAAVVGIVHGGLHPRDVLISPDDVRLTGFGVVRALERLGVQVPVRRPYAAPERAAGGAWDRRADVFTLATLAHELLWGRRITATGDDAAAALEELPGAPLNRLRDTFARALSENPAQRPPTALEFAAALRDCFGARPDQRPAPPQPATDYRRRPTVDAVKAADDPPPAAPLLALAAQEEPATITSVPEPELAPPEPERVEQPAAAPIDDLSFRRADPPAPVVSSQETVEALPLAAAPSIVTPEPPLRVEPPARVDPPLRVEHPMSLMPPEALNPARSAVWPLTLALVIGVALGFAGGYWLGQSERERDRVQADATTSETEVPLRADSTEGAGQGPAGTSAPTPPPAASASPAPAPVPETSRPDPPPVELRAPAPKPAPPSAAEASAETAVARTGRITVRTTPAGARVSIDGRAVGQAPLTIPNLGRGTHTVRVTRDGYTTVERRVVITANQPASTLTLNLTRAGGPPPRPAPAQPSAPLTADVLFESRPTGATVFMDGKRIGTTPMSLPSVRTGSHAIRFEMAGHKPFTASFQVVAGEKNRVAASLEQQ